MGSNRNKRWYDAIRSAVLGRDSVRDSDAEVGSGTDEEVRGTPQRDNPSVPANTPAEAAPAEQGTTNQNIEHEELTVEVEKVPPEHNAGPDLNGINDATSLMYVQTCFWVAHYVRQRAQRGDFSEDQLIEQFGVNVRKCINPEWKPEG